MRRFVVAFVVALMATVTALGLSGCGGGGGAAPGGAATSTAGATSTAAPSVPASTPTGVVFEQFPSDAEGIPASVKSRLKARQPMILLFVDPAQNETAVLKREVSQAITDNGDAVDLITYDIGKYSSVDSSGVVKIEGSDLASDSANVAALSLAKALDIGSTPYMVMVDDQRMVVFRARGFIDSDLIERQVQRLSE